MENSTVDTEELKQLELRQLENRRSRFVKAMSILKTLENDPEPEAVDILRIVMATINSRLVISLR